MSTAELLAVIGVIGGAILNVAAVAYGAGMLSHATHALKDELRTLRGEWDRRFNDIMRALETTANQIQNHESRIARVEERTVMMRHYAEPEDGME